MALVRLYRFRLLLRRAAVAPRELQKEVASVVRQTGVRTVATVRVTVARIVPLIFGIGHRSVLLLPESFMSSLSAEERSTVLAHELAHLQRGRSAGLAPITNRRRAPLSSFVNGRPASDLSGFL